MHCGACERRRTRSFSSRRRSGVNPTAHAHTLWPTVRASLDNLQDAFEPQGFDPRVDGRTFTLAMADATAAVFAPVLADECNGNNPR